MFQLKLYQQPARENKVQHVLEDPVYSCHGDMPLSTSELSNITRYPR